MKVSFFIDRPVFSAVISILIVIVGIIGLTMLPIDQYPQITPPVVNVSASWPGASAQDVAEAIAKKMGLKLEWRVVPFDAQLAAVSQDRYDFAIASHGYTEERAKAVDFGMTVTVQYQKDKPLKLTAENRPDAKVYRFPDLLDIFPKRGQVAVEKLIPPEDGQ